MGDFATTFHVEVVDHLTICTGLLGDEDIAEDIANMLALADTVANDDAQEMEVLSEGDGPHQAAAGAAVVQMQVTSHDFGFSCVAKVDYGSGFINVSAPLSMADFLRPVQGMAVQQFGAAWQQAGMVERKAQLPASSCRSAEAFMATVRCSSCSIITSSW